MLARLVAAFGLVAGVVGCGGQGTGSVTGKVTVAGVPVKQGTVMFHSADGQAVIGNIKEDGTYTLTAPKPGDGTPVGSYKVTISSSTVEGGPAIAPKSMEEEISLAQKAGGKRPAPRRVVWVVPEKYSRLTTSDLTAIVNSGSNEINFDIRKP